MELAQPADLGGSSHGRRRFGRRALVLAARGRVRRAAGRLRDRAVMLRRVAITDQRVDMRHRLAYHPSHDAEHPRGRIARRERPNRESAQFVYGMRS